MVNKEGNHNLYLETQVVFENLPTGYELQFLVDIGIALAAGFAIGAERESRESLLESAHTALLLAVGNIHIPLFGDRS